MNIYSAISILRPSEHATSTRFQGIREPNTRLMTKSSGNLLFVGVERGYSFSKGRLSSPSLPVLLFNKVANRLLEDVAAVHLSSGSTGLLAVMGREPEEAPMSPGQATNTFSV